MAVRKAKPIINEADSDATQGVPVNAPVNETEIKEAPAPFEAFRLNLIQLGNEMIEKVRGKQIDVCDGIDKIVSIYNAVK